LRKWRLLATCLTVFEPEKFRAALERWAPLGLSLFAIPVFTMAVPPGADMAMHVALARGLLHGALSPAWGSVRAGLYPEGFSFLVALLSPLGFARAGLIASAIAYAIFWAGLAAMLRGPLGAPWPKTVALVAVLLSKTPQTFFAWGGNPTAMALGLSLLGAAALDRQERGALRAGAIAALLLTAAAFTHPMGACAGGLAAAAVALRRRAWIAGAIAFGGFAVALGALALFGPHLSPRELSWIREYAAHEERAGSGVLGDPANVATALAAAVLIWKRRFRPVALAAVAICALLLFLAVAPRAGLYPARFAPLLLLAAAPLWGLAAAQTRLAPCLFVAAIQRATPMATRADLAAIECVDRVVPANAVIDGAYGDATQWIPALTGRAITRPHQHCSLFDETDAALANLPPARWRFVGERLRYPPPIGPPPASTPLCGGQLYPQ